MFPYRVIDLSHPIAPGMPLWPGDTPVQMDTNLGHDVEGLQHHSWTLPEHSGTHLGAPWHRWPGGETVDRFPHLNPRPLAIIDADAYTTHGAVTVADMIRWEDDHGTLEAGTCAVLRTRWDTYWPYDNDGRLAVNNDSPPSEWSEQDGVFLRRQDGTLGWPGWSVDVIDWLVGDRDIAVVGSDAPDIGTGSLDRLEAGERLAKLEAWHLENLRHLDQVPVTGAYLLIAPLALQNGTGSPARVMALVPRSLPHSRD